MKEIRNNFLEHQYKNLSFINQRRITLLLTDNYLKKLFNKISNKKKIKLKF